MEDVSPVCVWDEGLGWDFAEEAAQFEVVDWGGAQEEKMTKHLAQCGLLFHRLLYLIRSNAIDIIYIY